MHIMLNGSSICGIRDDAPFMDLFFIMFPIWCIESKSTLTNELMWVSLYGIPEVKQFTVREQVSYLLNTFISAECYLVHVLCSHR